MHFQYQSFFGVQLYTLSFLSIALDSSVTQASSEMSCVVVEAAVRCFSGMSFEKFPLVAFSYGTSTLALAREFARVFGFSLVNLSKFVSLDRLHWFANGFAVSCKQRYQKRQILIVYERTLDFRFLN